MGVYSRWKHYSLTIEFHFYRTYNRSHCVSISLLKTMLHFGMKYDMRRLRNEAVHCLISEFPSTLEQWSDQDCSVIDIDDDDYARMEGLFEILYLAHEHSITSILPALYLRICLTLTAVSRVVLSVSHICLNSCIMVARNHRGLSKCCKKIASR